MGSNPVQLMALVAVALCGSFALFLLIRRHPRWAMALWAVALFFTPVWLGVNLPGLFVTFLTGVTLLCIAAGIAPGLRWSVADTVMVVLLGVLLLAYAIGGAVPGHIQQSLLTWFLPYLWGRIVLARTSEDWVAACISAAALVASILAIVEFVTGHNIFLSVPGDPGVWGTLQIRGGELRVEGAFGHSIALGGTLAMSAAFVLTVRWPAWVRASILVVVGIATTLTFSRLGIVGFALTVLLGLALLGRYLTTTFRITLLSILAVGSAVAVPLLLDVFGAAGAEAEGSAGYRLDLTSLLSSMVLIGVSPSREVLATGEDYWGSFRSIDSALILIGLRFGIVCLAVVLLLLVLLVASAFTRSATPAGIALVAQIPAFATVALITQYASFVWFAAGLAVASYTLRRGQTDEARPQGSVALTPDVIGAK
ncbi:MAG: hypothetical protein DI566_09470 [Microbacterium sp.]|nr:MAG: hypothetical protein DI566_09470 [Microbacterium sp.]